MFFHGCPRKSHLNTLFVPVQFILVPDNRMVLNVMPCYYGIASLLLNIYISLFQYRTIIVKRR